MGGRSYITANDIYVMSSVHDTGGCGVVCHTGRGSVMESYQFEIFDQYFSVIVTHPSHFN